jgi:hypothetical protein
VFQSLYGIFSPGARKDKLDEALDTLKGLAVGKPVVIEETFALGCSANEWRTFIDKSRESAAGWIGFYWGQALAECQQAGTIRDAIVAAWLEEFARGPAGTAQ